MTKHVRLTATAFLTAGALCAAPIAATAATPSTSSAKPAPAASKIDTAFAKQNAQINFAQIAVGKIALKRSTNKYVDKLARVTMRDHKQAEALLAKAAKAADITLPKGPSAAELKQAAALQKVAKAKFNLTYVKAQVVGHEQSIAATNKEIKGGSSTSILKYAKVYLPIAKSHLEMAKADLDQLTGKTGS